MGRSPRPTVRHGAASVPLNSAAEPRRQANRPAPLDPLAFDKRAAAAGMDAKLRRRSTHRSGRRARRTPWPLRRRWRNVGARWRPWVDIRCTGWDTDDEQADIEGGQVNALVGITYKVSPTFLVGVFGGYENFDYSSDPLDADIDGDGWTGGAYLGWLITTGLRFDAGIAGSGDRLFGIAAGTADGNFDATRWMFTSRLDRHTAGRRLHRRAFREGLRAVGERGRLCRQSRHAAAANAFLDRPGERRAETLLSVHARRRHEVRAVRRRLWRLLLLRRRFATVALTGSPTASRMAGRRASSAA